MNNFILTNTYNFIKNNSNHTEEELLKIKYGLEGVYLNITKIIIILLIGFILDYLDTVIITLTFFNFLRFFAFGLHAKKSWQCLIFSILLFNILPWIFINIAITTHIVIIISLVSLISFVLFAPSDTEKRPLTNKKKRIIRKVFSIIVGCIFILLSITFKNLQPTILCALLIESIMITPLSYRLLGLSYNNYKKS